jgi:hypothetical protein
MSIPRYLFRLFLKIVWYGITHHIVEGGEAGEKRTEYLQKQISRRPCTAGVIHGRLARIPSGDAMQRIKEKKQPKKISKAFASVGLKAVGRAKTCRDDVATKGVPDSD